MTRRFLAAVFALLLFASPAIADPALTGTWSATVEGEPLVVVFDGKGGGNVNGRPMSYQVLFGGMLLVDDNGDVATYSYSVAGGRLQVAGGQFPGLVTFVRGTAGAKAARPGGQGTAAGPGQSRADLTGKWCKASSFSANAGGGSQSSACFELRADGSYVYGAQSSMSAYGGGGYGGSSSSSGDSGRWTATERSITAHSRSGQSTTYQLERRNHPRNGDPMLCLDGECYVTYWKRAPW